MLNTFRDYKKKQLLITLLEAASFQGDLIFSKLGVISNVLCGEGFYLASFK